MKDQIMLPPYLLNPLHPVTIHVVGCGGTGSRVLSELVKVDIALRAREHPGLFVTAFDPDIVSSENMARQLFYEDDLQMNKAKVLITRINQNYGLDWTGIDRKYQDGAKVGANIILCCLDKVNERARVIEHIKHEDTYRRGDLDTSYFLFDFGNGKDFGQILLTYIRKYDPDGMSKTYRAIMPSFTDMIKQFPELPKEDEGPSCSLAIALSRQSLFINGFLAMLGVNWLYEMLLKGYIDKSAIYFNMSDYTLSSEYIELPKTPKERKKRKVLV